MAQNGGKRLGAGRKPGKPNAKTLEKMKVQEAFKQRVLKQADALFNAQLALAVGSIKVFRIDEEEDANGKVKRIHTLVTNVDEIKEVLDEHDGGAGMVGESYYFVSDVMPQNLAVDSMLNRTFGKPKETHEIEHKGEQKVLVEFVKRDNSRRTNTNKG